MRTLRAIETIRTGTRSNRALHLSDRARDRLARGRARGCGRNWCSPAGSVNATPRPGGRSIGGCGWLGAVLDDQANAVGEGRIDGRTSKIPIWVLGDRRRTGDCASHCCAGGRERARSAHADAGLKSGLAASVREVPNARGQHLLVCVRTHSVGASMTKGIFEDREHALEANYFRQQDIGLCLDLHFR